MKSSPLIWHLLHNVKLTVKILSIFVAFLENINFNDQYRTFFFSRIKKLTTKQLHRSVLSNVLFYIDIYHG